MKMRCLVLSCMPYDMVTEDGLHLVGISVDYVMLDNLVPKLSPDGENLGTKPMKQSIPLELRNKLKIAPAIYDIVFEFKPVQGKPVMTPVDIEFVSEFEIVEKSSKK